VKGFILSAPSYQNSLKTSKFLIIMARLLSRIAPGRAVPVEDLRPHVTRDEAEYKRMREDERDGIQATKMSARMGAEFLKAQDWVAGHIGEWKYPMLAIIPGNDKVINSGVTRELLAKIDEGLVTEVFYPENYHESFNELNREEVFARIVEWCEPRIK
ncbi:MAG: alpha/beta hydrolase, partial [Bacteroidetes bacterium]|nr:alpha/beta hydrolase [Bacteroidota bacterium]